MTAERRQTLILITITVLTLGGMVLAFLVGRGEVGFNASTKEVKPLSTDKPRDITIPIARSEDAQTRDFDAEDLEGYRGSDKESRMLLLDHRLREKLTDNEGERAALEALSQLDPDKGVNMLVEQLGTAPNAAAATAMYSALGSLYLQTEPPQPERALESLREAERLAPSPEAKQVVLLAEVKLLQTQGGWAEAGPRLREAFPRSTSVTLPGLQLSVLLGRSYEDAGDNASAERVYRQTAEDALKSRDTLGKEADDVYRQACLYLARLYDRAGRKEEAETLRRDARRRLEPSAESAVR